MSRRYRADNTIRGTFRSVMMTARYTAEREQYLNLLARVHQIGRDRPESGTLECVTSEHNVRMLDVDLRSLGYTVEVHRTPSGFILNYTRGVAFGAPREAV